jgi:hypothetical protein
MPNSFHSLSAPSSRQSQLTSTDHPRSPNSSLLACCLTSTLRRRSFALTRESSRSSALLRMLASRRSNKPKESQQTPNSIFRRHFPTRAQPFPSPRQLQPTTFSRPSRQSTMQPRSTNRTAPITSVQRTRLRASLTLLRWRHSALSVLKAHAKAATQQGTQNENVPVHAAGPEVCQ